MLVGFVDALKELLDSWGHFKAPSMHNVFPHWDLWSVYRGPAGTNGALHTPGGAHYDILFPRRKISSEQWNEV